jgi:hypothetical protein
MATRNVAPRASGEGKIGTASLPWGEGNFNAINIGGVQVPTVASPVFTGTPTAPTATLGANTTQLATTAFVQAALAALSADVSGPGSSVNGNIPTWSGTGGDTLADSGQSIATLLARGNHTGTQLMSSISDAGTSATLDVAAAGDAAAGEVVKGNDSRLTNTRNPNAHASNHIQGGSDAIDADQLKIDVAFSTISPNTTPAEVSSATHLGAILKGIDDALTSGGTYTDENARDAIGAALVAGATNSIVATPDDAGDAIALDVQRKSVGLVAGSQASLGEDSAGLFVELGTTSNTAASGQDSRFPSNDEKSALSGTSGTPSGANAYVTDNDSRMTDSRIPTAHAANHSRSGSDPIDGDTIDINWNPSNYTPSTNPTEVTNEDELTAHLYGIDQALSARVLNSWSTSGSNISASNTALDANIPAYTLASPVTGDWIPFYDTGAGAMRRANFSSFSGVGGGSGPSAGAATELTIAHGVVSVTGNHHYIDTQGDSSTDDLETLGGSPSDGDIVYLYAASDARTVVIKHNAGDIYCWGGSDVTLDEDNKVVVAIYSSLYSRWMVLGGGGGGGGGASFPVNDTTALVQDPSVTSKQVRLDAGDVSASTTASLQAQDGNARAGVVNFERELFGTSTLSTGTNAFFLVCRRPMTITDMDGELNGTGGASDPKFRIRKNGSLVGTELTLNLVETGTSTNERYGTQSQDVEFAAGDTIEIQCTGDGDDTSGGGSEAVAPVVICLTGFYHSR